jgi:three-Cys-motif partner protein
VPGRRKKGNEPTHRFGGDWTSAKLDVLKGYLGAYATALKSQPFRIAYIDAFAGTGYRGLRADDATSALLFPELAEDAPGKLLDGSARIALSIEPQFDKYIFIERNEERCRALEGLRAEFSPLSNSIDIRLGEANAEIQRLCEKDWAKNRAVLFLDPYGMQVEWVTIEAIAKTKAIDLWVLFPLGIGVNRLLTRSGEIPDAWRRALDRLLGTADWYDAFYRITNAKNLLGEDVTLVEKASVQIIGRYFTERLKTIFAGVAERPMVLKNSANCPLYLFCFAAGNARGAPIALKIANHLLKKV